VPAPVPRRAETLTILNLKGGVGKTHTVWLLVGACEERGKRMLAIDADTQGNLTRSLLPEGARPQPGLEALVNPAVDADVQALIRKTRFPHVDLIPASAALAPFDESDQKVWEKADLHLSLVDPIAELRSRYDYIVIDCPPRLSLASFAALCASDHVIIPLEAADWGAQGVQQVTVAIDYVKARHNRELSLLGYLVSRFKQKRSFQWSYLKTLRQHFGKLAFATFIPDLANYEKSVTLGQPITFLFPASREAGTARSLFAEINRRISRSRRVSTLCRSEDLRPAGGVAV
jgi:chromosome partitioning protein